MIDKEQKFIDIHSILDYEALMPDRLETSRKAAEEINKVFGWNITVDKSDENSGENVSRETNEDGETND